MFKLCPENVLCAEMTNMFFEYAFRQLLACTLSLTIAYVNQ
jgi:hypothetical protein